MRRNSFRFRLHDTLLFTGVLAVSLTAYRFWPMDGLVGLIFSVALVDDTAWAGGYTDNGWYSIQMGMKRGEVYAILGPPLQVRTSRNDFDFDTQRQRPGEVVECWTHTPENSHYHVRQVVFKGDIVVDKQNDYYID